MTESEWYEAATQLKKLYSLPVNLDVDGYRVSLQLEQFDTYINVIMVYIDGRHAMKYTIKKNGEWTEEGRRFFQLSVRRAYSNKVKKELIKSIGVRVVKRDFPEIDDVWEIRYPYWKSFRSLKRHFIKENKQIRLLSWAEANSSKG
ncbi:MAG: hypothetical protein GY862_13255 [Gammaproteobacteria bacterium]|nr:hypothetical protein [Gammaproteobacteria bacterium]